MDELRKELTSLLAHKGELHRQAEAVAKALDSLNSIITHTEAKLRDAARQEKADADQVP